MFVHASEVRANALRLVGEGHNDSEIARGLAVPRTTVRDWRDPRRLRRSPTRSRLIRAMLPANRVGRVIREEGRMIVVQACSSHLSCLFPQHGGSRIWSRQHRGRCSVA